MSNNGKGLDMRKPKPALVFGASGEQGRAVIEGFVDVGYGPVYAFSRHDGNVTNDNTAGGGNSLQFNDQYLSEALGCILLTGDIANPEHVKLALSSTKAQAIFLVTTTDLPEQDVDVMGSATAGTASGGYKVAMDAEKDVILQFFKILKEVYETDQLKRTVVFSARDNVQDICLKEMETTGKTWVEPLDDGSIVPHYSAKGKGGEEALKLIGGIDGLDLILLTVPFFYSNFLAFFAPLPNNGRTQWELTACFGESSMIDMMSASDLGILVPRLVEQSSKYRGQNLRVSAEKNSMEEVAAAFSDLFGKDVVYNPFTKDELAAMDFPSAPAIAQMCQFLGDPRSLEHDCELTSSLMAPRRPTMFSDWLLTHSDSTAFSRVGLDLDGEEIISVTVFGATSPQGRSVIRGLLDDTRKVYSIRATTRRPLDSPEVLELHAMDPKRIQLVNADFDNVESCQKAVDGVQGVFLVADFYDAAHQGSGMETEERHTRNIIDACENSSVKHLVFSTFESFELVNTALPEKEFLEFSPRARMAAYARQKQSNLSVTFVLMPCYSEAFLDMVEKRVDENGKEKVVLQVPLKADKQVAIFCLEELGPAVANIFDSYECYSGHEIGLVSDFVSVSEVKEIFATIDIEVEEAEGVKEQVKAGTTYVKDLGQLFASLGHAEAVRSRHSVAKTFKLVPNARNLRRWVEQNKDNPDFREKLGLR